MYGIDVIGYEITEKPVGVEFFTTENNISSGALSCPETMIDAGRKLLRQGADVLAVVCLFQEPPEDDYENGEGVDIVGGVEAVISHYLSRELLCPCVHAPAFEDVSISGGLVNPKCSAEYITPTFLPCLLIGLNNAPLITKNLADSITNKNINLPFIDSKIESLVSMVYGFTSEETRGCNLNCVSKANKKSINFANTVFL